MTIHRYYNLELAIAKIVQNVLEIAKNENNILLKTQDFRDKVKVS